MQNHDAEQLYLVCPQCLTVNKLPRARLSDSPACAKCHAAIFSGHPVELTPESFQRHIECNGVPVVVDFWAPWCGPCRAMAPAYEAAAAQLEPHLRLAKVNTEAHPGLSAPFNIRGIPSLLMFRGGREIARQSGAMPLAQLLAWIRRAAA